MKKFLLIVLIFSNLAVANPLPKALHSFIAGSCTLLVTCTAGLLPVQSYPIQYNEFQVATKPSAKEKELIQALKNRVIDHRRYLERSTRQNSHPLPNKEFLGLFLASVDDDTLYNSRNVEQFAEEINQSDVNLIVAATWNKSESFIRNPSMASILEIEELSLLPKNKNGHPHAPVELLVDELDSSKSLIHWYEWGMRVALAQTVQIGKELGNKAPAFDVSRGVSSYIPKENTRVIAEHPELTKKWFSTTDRPWKQKTFIRFNNGMRYTQDSYGMIYAHLNFLNSEVKSKIVDAFALHNDNPKVIGVMLDDHFNVISNLAAKGKIDSTWFMEEAQELYSSLYQKKDIYQFSEAGKKKMVEFIVEDQMARLLTEINVRLKENGKTLIVSPAGWRSDSLLYSTSRNLKAPNSIQIYRKDEASFTRESRIVRKVDGETFCGYQSLPIIHNSNWEGSYHYLKQEGCKSVLIFHHKGNLRETLRRFSIYRNFLW